MIFVDANDVQYTPSEFLTFDDVQLIPQYSNIPSRNDKSISMECQFTSRTKMTLPIISANMDTVTESKMATTMFHHGGYGILHRFYATKYGNEAFNKFMADIQQIAALGCKPAFSVGVSPEELTVVQKVLEVAPQGVILRVDVAHGHSKQCIQQCRRLREAFQDKVEILAGNVATAEGVAELAFNGQVDGVIVGVGPGCFTEDTVVMTSEGHKPIAEIQVNDKVLTHTGEYQSVVGTMKRREEKELYVINEEIKCTNNHEFYVIETKNQHLVNEHNVHNYAKWVRADELSEKYMLVEMDT